MQDNLIVVGLPLYQGYIHYDCATSIANMIDECASHGYVLKQYYAQGPSLPIKRRQCVDFARKEGARWLLMVDSDIIVDNPKSLWLLLSRRKKIISGVYYGKQEPWIPILARYHDREYVPKPDETIEYWMENVDYEQCAHLPQDQIIEVDAVGGGFVLIDMACFDGMREPYFILTDYHGLGEDYFMCHKLKQLGHKIWVDTTIQLRHIGDYRFSQRDNLLGQEILKRKAANGLVAVP